mgnify:FL=1
MSELLMELSQRARALPAEERAALAELLLDSLAEPAHPSVQAAWAQELRRRAAAYERGEVQAHSAEDVFLEARKLTGE